jgi:hypothetical protein
MNYGRGFKRVYAVAAAVWVLFFGALAVSSLDTAMRPILGIVAIGGPIIGYFLFFQIVPWIGRGFK